MNTNEPKPGQDPDRYISAPHRWTVDCPCGLMRCLPENIAIGDEFSLVPCPRCGQPLRGKFLGPSVKEWQPQQWIFLGQ